MRPGHGDSLHLQVQLAANASHAGHNGVAHTLPAAAGRVHLWQAWALTAAAWSAQELQEIVGFPEYFEEEARYAVTKQQ